MSAQHSYEEARLNEYLEQYEKGEALRQMTDEVRADLMEQSVEEIATHLDGSLELELDSLMDQAAYDAMDK